MQRTYTWPSSCAMVKDALRPFSSLMEQLRNGSHIVPSSASPVRSPTHSCSFREPEEREREREREADSESKRLCQRPLSHLATEISSLAPSLTRVAPSALIKSHWKQTHFLDFPAMSRPMDDWGKTVRLFCGPVTDDRGFGTDIKGGALLTQRVTLVLRPAYVLPSWVEINMLHHGKAHTKNNYDWLAREIRAGEGVPSAASFIPPSALERGEERGRTPGYEERGVVVGWVVVVRLVLPLLPHTEFVQGVGRVEIDGRTLL